MQPRLVVRIGRHQHVDVVRKQGPNASKFKFLLDIQVHIGPARQVGGHVLHEPKVAGMAFHAHPQAAALTARKLLHALLGVLQLRQQALRQVQQVLPGLGWNQAPTFAPPNGCAKTVFELAHAVAQRRLRQVQALRRSGERTGALHLAQDRQMSALNHD